MGATSTQGVGSGQANKPSINDLAYLSNAPSILIAGRVESGPLSSPPIETGIVTFNQPLPGSPDNYVVTLTTLNGGTAYVALMSDDSNGNFSGFICVAEAECTVMYIVTKVGERSAYVR